ncbi:Oxysterol-binding protein-related protein 3 [Aphelenchoides fujianensis]|nr:Oxysterol-binding protein-related protein 3 [Aphelenchoides fujianensis]
MSTEAWTGVAGSMLLIASAAAFPFVCGRRGRGFSVQPRHLDRPMEPPSLDTSEGRPKTPFVAGGTTPASRSRSLRTGRSERSAAPASSDSDRRPLASPLAAEWTAKPSTSSRTTAGGTTRSRRSERAVGHHPAVSACHAEGDGWTWWQTLEGTTAPAFDGSVTTIIQNARAEADKRVVRNEGEMFAVEGNAVEGRVRGRGGERAVRLLGQIVASGEQVSLFEAPPPHEHAAAHYGFTRFTMALNELHDAERPLLPPTDSRFRPDQRLLENGEPERAEEAKKRLEKEQRGRSALAHRPLWFERERDAFTGRSLWLSNGRYWPAKEARFEDAHSRRMIALFSTDNSQ